MIDDALTVTRAKQNGPSRVLLSLPSGVSFGVAGAIFFSADGRYTDVNLNTEVRAIDSHWRKHSRHRDSVAWHHQNRNRRAKGNSNLAKRD